MQHIDLNNVQEAKEFSKIKPGGYICAITAVTDKPEKKYLEICFDIATGEHKNRFYDMYKQFNSWPNSGIIRRSYKPNALPFFKSFITAVENSNAGYKWDDNEKKLVKKVFGAVLAEEEYENYQGEIKTKIYVAQVRSVDKIKAGDFTVPELKKCERKADVFEPLSDEEMNDLPF